MRAEVWRIAKLAALLCLVSTPALAAATRPDPLASQPNCDLYRGSALVANDPTQLFELRVCPSPTGASATLQSSSLVSGYSLRASEGSWDPSGQTLTLVETRFIESRPEPGWHFCLIDELVLTKTATGLEGTYVSHACDDRAKLEFELVAPTSTTDAPGPAPEPPDVTPEPRTQGEPPTSPDERPSACACRSVDERRPSLMPLLLGLGLLVALGRRSRLRPS